MKQSIAWARRCARAAGLLAGLALLPFASMPAAAAPFDGGRAQFADGAFGTVWSRTDAQQVRGGFIVACAIDTTQRAWCWGDNAWGGFGNGGQYTSSSFPIAVAGNQRWLSVAPGTTHTCGVATTGDAYCWGDAPRQEKESQRLDALRWDYLQTADTAAHRAAWDAGLALPDDQIWALTGRLLADA